MADPITLGLLAAGSAFLALWRKRQGQQTRNEQRRITEGFINMDDNRSGTTSNANLPTVLTRDMPVTMDQLQIKTRVIQNLMLFRSTDRLFEQYMLYLRNRYYQKWELKILQSLEETLRTEIGVAEAASDYAATVSTLQERTQTKVLETKTKHQEAVQNYQRVQAGAPHTQRQASLKAENEMLAEEKRNLELKRDLAAVNKPKSSTETTGDPVSRAKAKVAAIKKLEEQRDQELAGLDRASDRAKRIKHIYDDEINRLMQEG